MLRSALERLASQRIFDPKGALLAGVLVALVAALPVAVVFLRAASLERAARASRERLVVALAAPTLERWLHGRASDVDVLAASLRETQVEPREAFGPLAARLLANHPEFVRISLVDRAGDAQASVGSGALPFPDEGRTAQEALAAGRLVTRASESPTGPLLVLAAPVVDGALVAALALEHEGNLVALFQNAAVPVPQISWRAPPAGAEVVAVEAREVERPLYLRLTHEHSPGLRRATLVQLVLGVLLASVLGTAVGMLLRAAGRESAALATALQLEQERRRTSETLAHLDRLASVGMLSASLAHEVSSPLAYVGGNVAFGQDELRRLQAEADPALQESLRAVEEALQDAAEGVGRIGTIVRDLKGYSRAKASDFGPVDLRRVTDAVVAMARAQVRDKAQLEVVHGVDVPRAWGSEQKILQILLNLVVNAAHAIAPGNPGRNRIRIATRREAEQVLVEVADTGSGIAPEVLARIFEPFFTTKPAGEGTGLGLAICRQLAEEMGGRLAARSTPGEGSTFVLTLRADAPLAPRA